MAGEEASECPHPWAARLNGKSVVGPLLRALADHKKLCSKNCSCQQPLGSPVIDAVAPSDAAAA